MLSMHSEPFSVSHFSRVIIAYLSIHNSSIGLPHQYRTALVSFEPKSHTGIPRTQGRILRDRIVSYQQSSPSVSNVQAY